MIDLKNPHPDPKRSRHTGESWCDQWDRVQRWFQRLIELEERHTVVDRHDGNVDITYAFFPEYAMEEVDVAYAFFMNCFHLKDWLLRSTAVTKENVESYIRASKALSACADICHGVKHFELTGARADINWRRARGYSESGYVALPFALIAGQQIHLTSLVRQCMADWKAFLEQQKLLETA